MNCHDVQEGLGAYWDMPADDQRRRAMDEHIAKCETCREEFAIWAESAALIRDTVTDATEPVVYEPVSAQVMKRIYADESWRIPVPQRMYMFSYSMRRKLTAVIAFCMTLFVFGFVLSLTGWGRPAEDSATQYGLKPVASVSAVQNASVKNKSLMGGVATASLKDPYMVKVGPIRTVPDYMVVVSLLGLTGTILIMSWLSRTKA
jgi:predicted anti-sigma-YlaC factor YlaD